MRTKKGELMNRRSLFKSLLGVALAPVAAHAGLPPARNTVQLQESSVAGLQYHDGEIIWSQLQETDSLQLVREPGNAHDENAVAVYWKRYKLGYLPRTENTTISQMLDRNEYLTAHVTKLKESRNPWARVQLAVELNI